MANFRRRRPRKLTVRGGWTNNSWRARVGLPCSHVPWRDRLFSETHSAKYDVSHPYLDPMNSYPAWWDRTFHTPVWRAKERVLERLVLRGADPDSIVWPRLRRPHVYYW
jgi:hypothetical protein